MIEHTGYACPVAADAIVAVDLGDGGTGVDYIDRAGNWGWGPGLGDDGEGRILRYEVLIPAPTE